LSIFTTKRESEKSGQGEEVAAFHGEFGRVRKYDLRGGTIVG